MADNIKTRPEFTSRFAFPAVKPRFDLLSLPLLRRIIQSRWPLFLARTVTLAGFVFTILVGLFGPRVGGHNFAIIFVWIAWWSALKLVFIPLGGRSWCSICPLPMPGEWLQQGRLVTGMRKKIGLSLRWPKKLRGYWLQAGFFLLVGLFSAVTLTNPRLTAWILLALILVGILFSLLFERRAFCTQICPIGGITGIYAAAAPLELRVKDTSLCATHAEKTCYLECPWGVYPLALRDNAACGLCMECVRVCPKDNLAVNLRPFGTDLLAAGQKHHLDEVFMALVMLGSALSFAAVFTGPWGSLKNAAYNIGSPSWFVYVSGFLSLNLLVLPGMFSLAVWLRQKIQQRKRSMYQAISDQLPALIPLGLSSWIAFTISFALPKFYYVKNVLSDPFGLGWGLFGKVLSSADIGLLRLAPFLEIAALLIGLYASLRWIMHFSSSQLGGKGVNAPSSLAADIPIVVFCLGYTFILMVLLVG